MLWKCLEILWKWKSCEIFQNIIVSLKQNHVRMNIASTSKIILDLKIYLDQWSSILYILPWELTGVVIVAFLCFYLAFLDFVWPLFHSCQKSFFRQGSYFGCWSRSEIRIFYSNHFWHLSFLQFFLGFYCVWLHLCTWHASRYLAIL